MTATLAPHVEVTSDFLEAIEVPCELKMVRYKGNQVQPGSTPCANPAAWIATFRHFDCAIAINRLVCNQCAAHLQARRLVGCARCLVMFKPIIDRMERI